MRVAAAVICWNPGPRVDACLAALKAQDHHDLEVLVIDNASEDGTAELVARRHPWAKLIANDVNLGFAGAANQAWQLAGGSADALMTLNPDVIASPAFVGRMVAGLGISPEVGSVAGLLMRPDGTVDSAGHRIFDTRLFRNRGEGEDASGYRDPGWVFGTTGAAALYRTVALDDAAGHDPAGFPWDNGCFAFWEDVDLDWRLARLGWKCRFQPDAVAVHERGVARQAASEFVEELNWRNRFRVVWRNDTAARFVANLPGFALTTLLKGGDLAATHPRALLKGTLGLRFGRRPLARLGAVETEPFDYATWVTRHAAVLFAGPESQDDRADRN